MTRGPAGRRRSVVARTLNSPAGPILSSTSPDEDFFSDVLEPFGSIFNALVQISGDRDPCLFAFVDGTCPFHDHESARPARTVFAGFEVSP